MDLDGGTDPAAALRHVVDEVYAAAPAEFITSRKAWVTRLRKAGLREVATEVAALRKPSVSAAAMNAVVRADDPVVAALVDLGARMRHAQSAMDMAGLSALRGERDEVLAAWVAAARAHAPTPLAGAAEAEVRDTAIAALADAAATEVVTSGSLTRALSYSGFGEVDVADAVARTSTGVVLTRIEGGASAGSADEPRPASGVRRNSRSSTRSAGPEAQDTDAEQPAAEEMTVPELVEAEATEPELDDEEMAEADDEIAHEEEPEEDAEPDEADADEADSDEERSDEEGSDEEAISRLTMELDEAEKVVAGARAARKEAADADAAARKAITVATEQVAQAERLLAGARRQLEKAEKASTTTAARLAEAEEELTASREQRDAARAALEEAEDR